MVVGHASKWKMNSYAQLVKGNTPFKIKYFFFFNIMLKQSDKHRLNVRTHTIVGYLNLDEDIQPNNFSWARFYRVVFYKAKDINNQVHVPDEHGPTNKNHKSNESYYIGGTPKMKS